MRNAETKPTTTGLHCDPDLHMRLAPVMGEQLAVLGIRAHPILEEDAQLLCVAVVIAAWRVVLLTVVKDELAVPEKDAQGLPASGRRRGRLGWRGIGGRRRGRVVLARVELVLHRL